MPPSASAHEAQAAHSVLAGAGLRTGAALQTTAVLVCARARPDGSSTQTLFTTGMLVVPVLNSVVTMNSNNLCDDPTFQLRAFARLIQHRLPGPIAMPATFLTFVFNPREPLVQFSSVQFSLLIPCRS